MVNKGTVKKTYQYNSGGETDVHGDAKTDWSFSPLIVQYLDSAHVTELSNTTDTFRRTDTHALTRTPPVDVICTQARTHVMIEKHFNTLSELLLLVNVN